MLMLMVMHGDAFPTHFSERDEMEWWGRSRWMPRIYSPFLFFFFLFFLRPPPPLSGAVFRTRPWLAIAQSEGSRFLSSLFTRWSARLLAIFFLRTHARLNQPEMRPRRRSRDLFVVDGTVRFKYRSVAGIPRPNELDARNDQLWNDGRRFSRPILHLSWQLFIAWFVFFSFFRWL